MARIELRNLRKQWTGAAAVAGVDLSIEDGAFIAVLGPSGCGKSTTLLMLAGIYSPTTGEIAFDGDFAELRRLLFDTEGREEFFDPLNAALAFGHFIDYEELREALATHLKWAQKRAGWVAEQQEYWRAQNIPLVQAKIIEHGLACLKAEIAWLEQFLQDLDAPEARQLKQELRSPVS